MERTFHHDRDALHGMTVVVTGQGVVHVGRCDDIRGGHILLLDVGWHRDGEDPGSRDEYLRKAVAFGVFPRARRLELPMEQVESIALLGELARGAGDA
ncbi:MAG: hypothetical protein H6693_07485 [Candidatus Latescibacteria bacterium]|nr:hypothetical protein [Candidatus Latescibacterota bacterium]